MAYNQVMRRKANPCFPFRFFLKRGVTQSTFPVFCNTEIIKSFNFAQEQKVNCLLLYAQNCQTKHKKKPKSQCCNWHNSVLVCTVLKLNGIKIYGKKINFDEPLLRHIFKGFNVYSKTLTSFVLFLFFQSIFTTVSSKRISFMLRLHIF